MDDRRFDALTRTFASGASRRNLLKGMVGAIFGGAAVATRLDSAGAQGCTVVEECEDGNPCTTNTCSGGVCTNPWIDGCCTSAIECEDNNPCTTNTCVANACTNPWIDGCCTSAIECEDNNPCTTNTCVANACTNPWIDGCCTSELECATPPDICTGISCIDNACVVEGGCPGETQPSTWTICCPQDSGSCAECCDDEDCGEGEFCENAAVRGLCQPLPTTTTTADPCPSDFFCGDECCPTQAGYTCCGGSSACCLNEQCNNETSTCCPEGEFPCGDGCCVNANNCCNGVCCPSDQCNQDVEPDFCCDSGSFACGTTEGNICCDSDTEKCCDDVCIPREDCCPSLPDCTACQICLNGTCFSDCVAPDVCTRVDCINGACITVEGGCEEGETCCDVDGTGIDCVNLDDPSQNRPNRPAYCGECGTFCDECEICLNGTCISDCVAPDACTRVDCINGTCITVEGGCPGETQPSTWTICCEEIEGGTCAECCEDAQCEEGEICENAAVRGVCVPTTTTTTTTTAPPICEERVDCVNVQQEGCPTLCPPGSQPGNNRGLEGVCCIAQGNGLCCSNSCTDGVCDAVVTTTTTTAGPTTTTTTSACLPEATYCYDNEDCCSGCCGQNSEIGQAPNTYCLPAEDCTCRHLGETCGILGDDDDDDDDVDFAGRLEQQDCCDGLFCLQFDDEVYGPVGNSYCAECRHDHHCDKGYHCCHGQCISEEYCCSDYDCDDCEECFFVNGYGYGYCELTGVPFGEYCSQITLSDDSIQGDCCDGLVCCEVDKDGEKCFECCGDWDCPKGSECRHGVCEFECSHDKDCPDDTCCCKSGHCSKHCCHDHHHPPKTPKPDTGGGTDEIDTLPATGAGPGASSSNVIGTAILGAAAAYVAAKKLRDQPETSESADS